MNKGVCHTACHHLVKSKKYAQYQDTWISRAKKMKLSLPTELPDLIFFFIVAPSILKSM